MISRLTALWLLVLLVGDVYSEDYTFRVNVDRDSVTVGDPILLRFILDVPPDSTPEVIPDIKLPPALRVLDAPDAQTTTTNAGRIRWAQTLKLAAFRPGEVLIEDLQVRVVPTGRDTVLLSDDPISLLVASVKPDSLRDILDVKGPVSIDAFIPVWVWVTAILLILAIVAYVLWRRRRSGAPEEEPEPEIIDWFEEVRKLMGSDMLKRGEFDSYYTGLSEALRRYIEQATGVVAMERTTFEIRQDLEGAGFRESSILEIEGFLTEADLVKFARFEPDASRAGQDGERVLNIMSSIRSETAPPAEVPTQ